MKCLCGYEEPKEWEEQVEILFKSGLRKGQLNKIQTVIHEVKEEDKFIKLRVEKDFGFVKTVAPSYSWGKNTEQAIDLFACPKCKTVRMR